MNRRDFLKRSILAAGAVCVDFDALAKAVSSMGEARLKIGILSDIHIRKEKDVPVFQKALEFFRDKGADGVILAGDLADFGLLWQLERVSQTWYKVFPNDKAPDGRKVEKLFVYGNHDMEGFTYGRFKSDTPKNKQEETIRTQAIAKLGREKVWQQLFHEKFSKFYIKDVKGYKFLGAHWANWHNMPGLDSFVGEHRHELTGQKPFFFFQHPHPKGTCSAPWVWGQDNGETTKLFSQFPNCIAFSGHSHQPLTDERTIWQGSFTSVGTASLKYICPFEGRENFNPALPGLKNGPQMSALSTSEGKHGMFMTVYDDAVILQRHEFVFDEDLGDNWIIPLPFKGEKTLSFEYRAKHEQAPRFAQHDKITVSRAKGKNLKGKEMEQLTVHFPCILKKHTGIRANDYEVQMEVQDTDTRQLDCCKRVYAPKYYLGEGKGDQEVVCIFGFDELPDDCDFRFHVTPYNCFGTKGRELVSELMKK